MKLPQRPAAFSLLEVTVATGVVAFALVAIIGLLPIGLRSIRNGTDQVAAAGILRTLECDLLAAGAADGTTRLYGIDLLSVGYQGTVPDPIYLSWEGTRVPNDRTAAFRLFIEIFSTAQDQPLRCRAKVSWPPKALIREDGGAETASGTMESYFAIPDR